MLSVVIALPRMCRDDNRRVDLGSQHPGELYESVNSPGVVIIGPDQVCQVIEHYDLWLVLATYIKDRLAEGEVANVNIYSTVVEVVASIDGQPPIRGSTI